LCEYVLSSRVSTDDVLELAADRSFLGVVGEIWRQLLGAYGAAHFAQSCFWWCVYEEAHVEFSLLTMMYCTQESQRHNKNCPIISAWSAKCLENNSCLLCLRFARRRCVRYNFLHGIVYDSSWAYVTAFNKPLWNAFTQQPLSNKERRTSTRDFHIIIIYARSQRGRCCSPISLNIIWFRLIRLYMHHLTCGIRSLLHSVNLILFTLLMVHIILRISPHHSHHLRLHHLSLLRPFTPDLKLISFTNPFLHSHSYSFWTAFTDVN